MAEVIRWPLSEVLAWKSLFDIVGPLDWTREDMLDARRHAFKYGKSGDTIGDHIFYTPIETGKTEAEKAEENIRKMIPIAAVYGGEEAVEHLKDELKRIRIEAYRADRND